ncbi:3-keto-5-aminohexanoate cleavage protein [Streptomyces sp. NBC_00554]|uniref:3-keto-5-aminohexanoate cleavage protein n=1 Tax=unclassified Streptomyces TaxID=2593676 RepID=UPI003251DA4F|nr:3-keto-5-aminohexanoate cleavage protein [Streptomyces sp. NBC_00554]
MSRTSVTSPVVIEAAITPLRKGEPLQTSEELIHEATESLAGGAAIVHHHHDFRQTREGAIAQIVHVESEILKAYPEVFVYNDYLRGEKIMEEKNAHLPALAQAGVLTMAALDPGLTQFGMLGENGLPSIHVQGGADYASAHEVVEFADRTGTPLSLGVYDPSNLRWILAYAAKGLFPAGSMIKLYFGGEYQLGGVKWPTAGFGLPPTNQSLDMYLSLMEGCDLPWIVSIQGGVLLDSEIAQRTLELGGHLRVGVEDTAGATAMSNRETVEAAVALAEKVGRPVATGAQAHAVLKGGAA